METIPSKKLWSEEIIRWIKEKNKQSTKQAKEDSGRKMKQ